jgi:hypothetical protein
VIYDTAVHERIHETFQQGAAFPEGRIFIVFIPIAEEGDELHRTCDAGGCLASWFV